MLGVVATSHQPGRRGGASPGVWGHWDPHPRRTDPSHVDLLSNAASDWPPAQDDASSSQSPHPLELPRPSYDPPSGEGRSHPWHHCGCVETLEGPSWRRRLKGKGLQGARSFDNRPVPGAFPQCHPRNSHPGLGNSSPSTFPYWGWGWARPGCWGQSPDPNSCGWILLEPRFVLTWGGSEQAAPLLGPQFPSTACFLGSVAGRAEGPGESAHPQPPLRHVTVQELALWKDPVTQEFPG